ncbi:hypothetical protein [Deinococcus arenicola]|uniref:Integrase catalytic domain-containing protein n=1 Tax=Deinococcus arenicola TaxID=2994950 RepID=A0ABU4DQ00_9DEIO|nr:hypothetical protein [Deinococcus sp. ZS9-10]MDV6374174.1 hypothetical protein [Deinococcus sp. ZS9-10]
MNILVNSIFIEQEDIPPILVRVVYISAEYDILFYVFLDDNFKLPKSMKLSDAKDKIRSRVWKTISEEDAYALAKIIDPVSYYYKDLGSDSEKNNSNAMETAWKSISDIVDNKNEFFFDKSLRSQKYILAARESGASLKTIYLRVGKFYAYGQVKQSLYPVYSRRGGRGKSRNSVGVKRGRPRTVGRILGDGINIAGEEKVKLVRGINSFYISRNFSLETAYQATLDLYFPADILQDKLDADRLNIQQPTKMQFRYWAKKILLEDYAKNKQKQVGEIEYGRSYREMIGKSLNNFNFPGACYIGDGTELQINLVDKLTRLPIKRKARLYVFIDSFSHRWMGFFISLNNLSYNFALAALYCSCVSKEALLKQYGIVDKLWDDAVIPLMVHIDGGEFRGKRKETLTDSLGIGFIQDPPYRPDLKGLVEGAIKLLKKDFLNVPGSYEKFGGKPGSKLKESDAILSIDELTNLLLRTMLHQNKHIKLSLRNLPDEAFHEGVRPHPDDIWAWGMKNRPPPLRLVSQTKLTLALMERGVGKITSRGIQFKGNFYIHSVEIEKDIWAKARAREVSRRSKSKADSIKVMYNPWFAGSILIELEDGGYHTCLLSDKDGKFSNYSHTELVIWRESESSHQAIREFERRQDKKEDNSDLSNIVDNAKSKNLFAENNRSIMDEILDSAVSMDYFHPTYNSRKDLVENIEYHADSKDLTKEERSLKSHLEDYLEENDD